MTTLVCHRGRTVAFTVAFVVVASVLNGCGGSDDSPLPPVDENPFHALVAGSDSTLDIATWNLHLFALTGGAETVALVAQAVTAMDVDVVALQEISQSWRLDELVAQLPGWQSFFSPSGGDWSLAYLWRTETVTLGPDAVYEIFGNQSNPFPRPPLILDMVFGGRSVLVIDNHLKCCGNGILNQADSGDEENRRFVACGLLDDWIASEAAGRAVVLVGDLNDKLDDAVANNVFQVFLDHPESYHFADWEVAIGPAVGWSWGPGTNHLDHVLITDELFAAFATSASTCRTIRLDLALPGGEYENLISDHAPVVLSLDMR